MKEFGNRIWSFLEGILRFFVYRVFRLKLSEEAWSNLMQFIKFGIVGLSNTVVSYAVYLLFFLLFKRLGILPRLDYLVAQFIGFLLSVLWSFWLNSTFVFTAEREGTWLQALLKTYASYAFTGILLNSVLSILWVEVLGISKLIAPIMNLLISVPINFVLNKFWAFREKR